MNSHHRSAVALLAAAGVVAVVLPAVAQRAPAPESTGLSSEVLSLACNPSLTYTTPQVPLRVTGGQESFVHQTYSPGDLVTINAGTDNGIEVGPEFFTRQALSVDRRPISREHPATIRTTGWIRVYAVDKQMSLATITHACDAVERNDYLEPFVLPVVPTIASDKPTPQKGNYGRLLTGNDNRASFGRGDYFLVDRGSDHGVTLGAQFVVYRERQVLENFLFELGEAVAVDVRPESSTLRATVSRDAFTAGDYVAIRK